MIMESVKLNNCNRKLTMSLYSLGATLYVCTIYAFDLALAI